ncbi:MAG: serine hydrolase, partial [Mucinivorans sp.]
KSSGGNNIELLEGAGGWIASPVELLRLVAAVDPANSHPKILSTKSIRMMTEYSKGKLPIGWANVNAQGDWWRSGTMAGTSAMLRRQSNGYTWMMVTNTSSWKGARFSRIINSMLQRAFGKVASWPDKDMFQMSVSAEDSL